MRERERERESKTHHDIDSLIESLLSKITTLQSKLDPLLCHTEALQKAEVSKNANNGDSLTTLLKHIPTPPQQGWERAKLGDLCDFRRGPFGGSLKKEIFVSNGYKIYEQQHAINNNFELGNYYITQEKFNAMKSFEVLPNDLIVSCSGTIGKIAIAPNDIKQGIINQALLRLRIKDNKIFSKCLKIILDNSHNPFEANSLGAGLKNVASVDTLKQIKIPLPPLNEQEKISHCIEKIESQISNLSQAILQISNQKAQILEKFLK